MPQFAPPGVILNGQPAAGSLNRGYPDVRSYRRKFGLMVPATNTSTEHELWSILLQNPGLEGIGIHTVGVVTPRPVLETDADLEAYKEQFLRGLRSAVDTALLAGPEYMILGMSLEHILSGLAAVRQPVVEVEAQSGLAWATWHDAIHAALSLYRARRIGWLTPFDRTGNEYASRLFTDLGYEVVSGVGFSCANSSL